MATIHDVAREAGVSSATVSRVMSSPARVARATRNKVLATMERLGYAPNVAAKTLRTLRTERILVTVQNIASPFCSRFIRGVEEAASEAGYSVLLGDTRRETAREEQYAAMLRRREADGLIYLGHRLFASLAKVIEAAEYLPPIVNACGDAGDQHVPSVRIDNERAAIEVMDHLHGLGHKRFGIVTGPLTLPNSRDRLAGVRAAAGRYDSELVVAEGDFSIESGLAKTLEVLSADPRPTAVFCFSDEMAMGALEAFRRLGLSCPRDVSLVGFDDIRYAKHLDPQLTTVSQPMEEIGHEVFQMLLSLMSTKSTVVRHVTLAHRLVVRSSTAPAALDVPGRRRGQKATRELTARSTK